MLICLTTSSYVQPQVELLDVTQATGVYVISNEYHAKG